MRLIQTQIINKGDKNYDKLAQSNIMSASRPFSSKVTVFSRLLTTLPMSLCQALHQPRIRLLATPGPNRTERDQKHPVSYKKWLNNIVSKLTKSQNEPISEKIIRGSESYTL